MTRPTDLSVRTLHSLSLRRLSLLLLLLAIASSVTNAASSEKPLDPCTIRSPSSKAFFDLNPIQKQPATEKQLEKHKNDLVPFEVQSWHAKGHDYDANFTINFCGPVVEKIKDVEGVDENLWVNVSAYYVKGGRTYSIGTQNSEPVFRGRKLVLNYTDGSPCPDSPKSFDRKRNVPIRSRQPADADLPQAMGLERPRPGIDADSQDDGARHTTNGTSHDGVRRKSTIMSLLCDKDPTAPKAAVSFVGSMDECTYFFEVRSLAACAGVETPPQSLGPGGVFGVIAMIAFLVYIVGGCFYQRTVMHQRGWRQLPNYKLWSGIASALKDSLIILTSSCARFLPSRRGYSRVSAANAYGYGRGRRHSEDENRLIDQLDEEWDD